MKSVRTFFKRRNKQSTAQDVVILPVNSVIIQEKSAQQQRIDILQNFNDTARTAIYDKITGRLTDENVYLAAKNKNRVYVLSALSILTRRPFPEIEYMLSSQHPLGILTLCWAGELSAKTAYQIQIHIAGIALRRAIIPADNGGYRFSDMQMQWNYDFIDDVITDAGIRHQYK
jgi:hypothetical protein